jgi:hypothetical protein
MCSAQAAEKRATGLEAQLAALQTAQGVAELAERAAGAEAWRHRADAAAEQLERLRGAYQHGRRMDSLSPRCTAPAHPSCRLAGDAM